MEKSWDVENAFYKKGTFENKLFEFRYKFQITHDPHYLNLFCELLCNIFPSGIEFIGSCPNCKSQYVKVKKGGQIISYISFDGSQNKISDIQTFLDNIERAVWAA